MLISKVMAYERDRGIEERGEGRRVCVMKFHNTKSHVNRITMSDLGKGKFFGYGDGCTHRPLGMVCAMLYSLLQGPLLRCVSV